METPGLVPGVPISPDMLLAFALVEMWPRNSILWSASQAARTANFHLLRRLEADVFPISQALRQVIGKRHRQKLILAPEMCIKISQLMAPKIGKTTVLLRKRVNSSPASSEIHERRVPQKGPYPDGLLFGTSWRKAYSASRKGSIALRW